MPERPAHVVVVDDHRLFGAALGTALVAEGFMVTVPELTDLARARQRLIEARSLVGQSDHGTSLSLYAKDPDGLEFELFWTVPDGKPAGTRPLDLAAELARRGLMAH